LVNGNFQECLSEILERVLPNLKKLEIMAKMNVTFERSQGQLLQGIMISYDCEWPIEIVVDKQTIYKGYNKVFRLLVKIKYAKYLMEKREYHIKHPNLLKKTNSYSYARINYQ
jgi:ribosomal protein S17